MSDWPKTLDQLEADGYVVDPNWKRCSSCSKPILWAMTKLGSRMQLSVAHQPSLFGSKLPHFESHNAVCPDAAKHRRKSA